MASLALLIPTEKLDRLHIAANLTAAAASMGWSVHLFFTFWGLLALVKGREPSGITGDYMAYESSLKKAVESGVMPRWADLIRQAKQLGDVKIYACSATMNLLSIDRDQLEDFVDDVVGAATFLSIAEKSDVSLVV